VSASDNARIQPGQIDAGRVPVLQAHDRAEYALDSAFEGDLGLVRFDLAQQRRHVGFCRGCSLHVGTWGVTSSDAEASFEIDLAEPEQPLLRSKA
jgi:hypothetical protein